MRAAAKSLGAVLCEALRRLFVTFVVSQNRPIRAVTFCQLDLDEPTLRAPAGPSELCHRSGLMHRTRKTLFDHLICASQQRWWDLQSEWWS
jgi:hypothetical protein